MGKAQEITEPGQKSEFAYWQMAVELVKSLETGEIDEARFREQIDEHMRAGHTTFLLQVIHSSIADYNDKALAAIVSMVDVDEINAMNPDRPTPLGKALIMHNKFAIELLTKAGYHRSQTDAHNELTSAVKELFTDDNWVESTEPVSSVAKKKIARNTEVFQ